MTMPPEQIEVKCPRCGRTYKTWYRPSMNLGLDNFSPAYVKRMSTATCPHCRHKVSLDVLVVREDGVWEFGPRSAPPDGKSAPDGRGGHA